MKKNIKLSFISLLLLVSVLSGCTGVPAGVDDTSDTATNTGETPIEESSLTEGIPSDEAPSASTNNSTITEPSEKKPISQLPQIPEVTSPFWLSSALEDYESPKTLSELPTRDAALEKLFAVPADGSDAEIKNLSDLQEKIGIDYLAVKQSTFDVAYTITRFYDAELNTDKYVYCQFEEVVRRENMVALDSQWVRRGQYVLSRRISLADIGLLAVEDPLSELSAIDPAFEKALLASPSLIIPEQLSLILEDGLVNITCEKDSGTGAPYIKTIQRIAPAGEYTPDFDPVLFEIPLPEIEVSVDPPETGLPMSQFPTISTSPGWLEATLKSFEQPTLDELPERGVYIEDFYGTPFGAGGGGNFYAYEVWHVQNLSWLDCLIVLDSEHVCSITKISDKNSGIEKYAYCVFKKEIYREDFDGKFYEAWNNVQEIYWVSKSLSSKDFSRLAIGDSITELLAIEPAVQCGSPIDGSRISSTGFSLLLEDGLLHVQTSDSTTAKENLITHIKFHPYGEAVTIDGIDAFMAVSPVRPPLPGESADESGE